MGVGGGEQVGGQDRARDGAGAGHHHLGVSVSHTGVVVVFHASQSTPQSPCLSLLCTHLLRVPGGEEGAGPQLADDLVAELGAGVAAVIGEAWVPELETKVAEDYVKFYNH